LNDEGLGTGALGTYHDFTTALMSAIGIGPIPIEAFVRTKPARFFGDWVETEESQRLLQDPNEDSTSN
jgi:hypothetical protein